MMTARATTATISLRTDLLLSLFLVALCVAGRLLPHVSNFTPVAAAALFAGMMLSRRWLALAVPLIAMPISDLVLGFDDARITASIYLALALPAVLGMLAQRWPAWRVAAPAALTSSLLFFVITNFAVWAFSGMYSPDVAGLIQCYTLALPFLKYTVAGDLFWTAALFGGAWLLQRSPSRSRSALTTSG
jgi:hypothetical protein